MIPGSERSPREGIDYLLHYSWASLMAQMVKNLPAVWEIWVQSLGWEDPLEEGMAIHSSILAWRIPRDRSSWPAAVHGVTKNQTGLSDFHFHFSLLLGRWNRQKESKMAVAKRQERSKEGPRTRVKTSGRTNSTRG